MTDTHVSNEMIMEFTGWIRVSESSNWWSDNKGILTPTRNYIHNLQLVHDDLESRLTTDNEWHEYLLRMLPDQTVAQDRILFSGQLRFIRNADAQTCCDAFAKVKARGG